MSSAADQPAPKLAEVSLGAVPDRTLLRVLRRRGYFLADDECDEDGNLVDGALISLAGQYFARGDTAEALHWLERALPDTFAGLAARAASFHGGRS